MTVGSHLVNTRQDDLFPAVVCSLEYGYVFQTQSGVREGCSCGELRCVKSSPYIDTVPLSLLELSWSPQSLGVSRQTIFTVGSPVWEGEVPSTRVPGVWSKVGGRAGDWKTRFPNIIIFFCVGLHCCWLRGLVGVLTFWYSSEYLNFWGVGSSGSS